MRLISRGLVVLQAGTLPTSRQEQTNEQAISEFIWLEFIWLFEDGAMLIIIMIVIMVTSSRENISKNIFLSF